MPCCLAGVVWPDLRQLQYVTLGLLALGGMPSAARYLGGFHTRLSALRSAAHQSLLAPREGSQSPLQALAALMTFLTFV